MSIQVHAYNKDCDGPDENSELFLNRLPDVVSRFFQPEFDASLVYRDDGELCVYLGHVSDLVEPDTGKSQKDRVIACLTGLNCQAVFIRCSSVDQRDPETHRHRIVDNVPVLHLRPSFSSEVNWDQILRLTDYGVASEIVAGNVPTQLVRYFGDVRTSSSLLPALSILCQGYLDVQAGPHKSESFSEGAFKNALINMGWDAVLSDDEARESLNPALRKDKDDAKRKMLIGQVSSAKYWQEPFSKVADLLPMVEAEWKGPKGETFNAVKRLIPQNDGALPFAIDRDTVAAAYNALYAELGGTA